ncbi:MAG: FHA domain-containing protein [Ilumatobacteraceae bacterium]
MPSDMGAAGGSQLWLRLDEWGDQPLLLCLTEDAVIGRDFRCDLVVHDDEVSRMHARLTPDLIGWTVIDLATTNGTYVNDERIVGPAAIVVGDVISIGRATCTVVESPG